MRTAEALKKAAESMYPSAQITVLDTFHYASPFLEKVVIGTYMEILKNTPVIYGYLYRQAERGQPLSGRGKLEFNRILNIMAAPKLIEYINLNKPDAIVCTHPFPLGIINDLKKKGTFHGLAFAAITDFTIHSFWVFPEVDYYLVGSEELAAQCRGFGIGMERVRITGIPIDEGFNCIYDKIMIRKQLGLDPDIPTILIMGGGLGMGPLAEALRALGSNKNFCQLIVVTGENNVLREKLTKEAQKLTCNVKIFGFVDNIPQLMAASDIMVGKAGGLTCAEAMAMRLPLFIIDPLPGQEERNAEFMTSIGAGIMVEEKDLSSVVYAHLSEPGKLEQMICAAAKWSRPNAARDAVLIIAEAIERERLSLNI